MNIKITIKDSETSPALITRKQISQVEFKKKNMLYAAPTKDKKTVQNTTSKKSSVNQTRNNINPNTQYYNNPQFQQAQKKLVQDLSQISKNQVTMDMIHNSNTILQRQNQILQSNQKTLNNIVSHSRNNNSFQSQNDVRNRQIKKTFQEAVDKVAKQVKEIKKMKDQILEAGQQFKKLLNQGRPTNVNKGTEQIGQMNSNLKNLVQLSKNHIQGLQNLQGIKNLQNFNIQAYTQSINTLKKQIVTYQKESQTIQRELKLRAAKLQKLQISPNFDQELLQPYEQYLKKKADSIDLHSIKQKVYQKLGVFDYGKFQFDISSVTNQIKNQMNDFYIICKQYRIQTPDIKIDKKQLKQLDLKLPSVLDQFKASRGIVFNQQKPQAQKPQIDTKKTNINTKNISKEIQPKKNAKNTNQPPFRPQELGVIYTKPTDYSNNVKLTRLDKNQYQSVLQTKQQQQKKQVYKNIQKKSNPDDDFEKYLENRAKQELAAIYQQKRKKLQKMQNQLYKKCIQEPKYELTLNVKNKISPKKQIKRQPEVEQNEYENQEFQFQQQAQNKSPKKRQPKRQLSKEKQQIKSVGTQVLRQKLKNLFQKNPNLNVQAHQNRFANINQNPNLNPQGLNQQMTSVAQGFINMINNTLTQVNSQLSQSIQKKIQNRTLSKQRRGQFEQKSPNKIIVPKLQQFRAPPVFNMQMVQQPVYRAEQKRGQKKIVAKNYDHLRIKQENDSDLQVSAMSFDD